MTPEKSWGMALAAYDRPTFEQRVYRCTDAAKLRAAIEHEIEREGDVRRERVGLINQRLARIAE